MKNVLEGVRMHPQRREWDDVSDYVAHFTKDAQIKNTENHSSFQLVSILRSGVVQARSKWGAGRAYSECPHSVCLSETPVHQLKRVAARRSPYGLGFHKDFIVRRGGGPVMYAYRDHGDAVDEMIRSAVGNQDHAIWRLAPFVDQPRQNYSFEWEREWRVPADLAFHPNQVSFITGPEDEHDRMITYFRAQELTHGLPAYRCPLIDLQWSSDRVRQLLQ